MFSSLSIPVVMELYQRTSVVDESRLYVLRRRWSRSAISWRVFGPLVDFNVGTTYVHGLGIGMARGNCVISGHRQKLEA